MTDPELTERQRTILGLVIREYINSAQPVGSKTILDQYPLGVSPATVRNEMAALEDENYLTHPHTSAGRVPTEKGYRYFVEHLMNDVILPPRDELTIRHQFHQARLELDQWVKLSAAVLAHTARSAAVATAPKAVRSHYKHLELIAVSELTVLLVLVLLGGTVKQQLLTLDQPVTQEELSHLSNELNDVLSSADAETVRSKVRGADSLKNQIGLLVAQLIERVDGKISDQIYREGLVHILSEPEFASGEHVHKVVAILEESAFLDTILDTTSEIGDVQVIIGGEGRWDQLSDLSLVLSRYGVTNGATGVLGVVGPMRMPYNRTIALVRYVSSLMSDLVRDWYGIESTDRLG